ncbi:MAG: peptide deformylase [Chloroflexi bacterium]|nr:peptide deformylase [Chloroflexota bacterium]
MSLLPIIIAPDQRLKRRSEPVGEVDDEVRRLMDDMLETMHAAPGIGLSAIQVGVSRRIITLDVASEGGESHVLRLVDPEIIWLSPETEMSITERWKSNFATTGLSTSSGKFRILSTLFRMLVATTSPSAPNATSTSTKQWPSRAVVRILSMPITESMASSIGMQTPSSTSIGDAPG